MAELLKLFIQLIFNKKNERNCKNTDDFAKIAIDKTQGEEYLNI